ncbi:MFS transporter permease [uncultured Desulfobacter sp.]|uniref:MFS transporter permease n=1 Tax=uncultured Desulfobacter sp. TaxID=240139 RepID=UPI002AAAF460|nr:MFS transporter permease [uncultured Desulfobacter sp.]
MGRPQKQRIIPKEQAVFWMDKDGTWHNEHGKLEHPKIIRYFNQSIQKDGQGYFLCQILDDVEERVYFPYEDTAVFVVDLVRKGTGIELALNTLDAIALDPESLYINGDALFMETDDHLIKFSQKALAQMAAFLTDTPQGLALNYGQIQTIIHEK